MKKFVSKNRALSLLELMMVVIIIGFIAALVVPRISTLSSTAKQKTCNHNRAQINSAIEAYYLKNATYPSAIADIDTTDTFPSGIPTCPVSEGVYAIDLSTHRVQGHTSSHP